MDYFTLNIFVMLGLGFITGYIIRHKHLRVKIDNYLVFSVIVLLFLIGINLGNNENVIKNIIVLGIQSFVLAITSIIGSAITAYVISRYVKK